MNAVNFIERENNKLKKEPSREKAIAFSLEDMEGLFNNLALRDPYNNNVLNEMLGVFFYKDPKGSEYLKDNFIQITEYTLDSLEKIIKNPKKQLVKFSELQNINSVMTTDFKTMRWLGSKPGKTLAEKIGVKGKVLAPKNRYSIDKKENRIVGFYFKKINELFEKRYKIFKNNNKQIPIEFMKIYNRLQKLKREMILNDMYSLRRPLDFEPNNTLIDHRDYSVINRGLRYLNDHIENSEYIEEDVLNKGIALIFLRICSNISKFNKIKVVDNKFNLEEKWKEEEKKIEFYLQGKPYYYIKCSLNKNIIYIETIELAFSKNRKIIFKTKESKGKKIKLNFKLFESENKSNILNFEVIKRRYSLDQKGIETFSNYISSKIFENIEDLSSPLKNIIKKQIWNEDSKIYLNLNSSLPILENKTIPKVTYNNKYNNFFSLDEYYYLQDKKANILAINQITSNNKNIEVLSKYLKELRNKDIISKKNISIYSSLEALDTDIQKDIFSILNSNFKKSYPIWKSVLASYSVNITNKWIKEKDKIVVIDVNSLIPSINIIEMKNGIYEHHPALNYELKDISLNNFLRKYLEKYIKVHEIKLEIFEKENLINSGKVYSSIFNNTIHIISKENSNFYLQKDDNIFKELQNELNFKLKREKDKFINQSKFQYNGIILIGEYLNILKDFDTKKVKILKEKDLSLEKEIIHEKIANNKTVWNEFLPNLTLETLKENHFYNLHLIKNKAIGLTLGKEEIFDVDDKLILPAEITTINFPLHSEDSLNKKTYSLEVRSNLFPLKSPMEVGLKIGYSYGSKDPYRMIIEPTDKNIISDRFVTKWLENIDEFEMKHPDFPEISNTLSIENIFELFDRINKFTSSNMLSLDFNKGCKDLKNYLKNFKNRIKKYIAKEMNQNNFSHVVDDLFNHENIKYLVKIIKKDSDENLLFKNKLTQAKGTSQKCYIIEFEDLADEINLFLGSFGFISDYARTIKPKEKLNLMKRNLLYLYKVNENAKLGDYSKSDFYNVKIISEIAWLDNSFMEGLMKRESTLIDKIFKFLKIQLIELNQNFDKEYRTVYKNDKIWQLAGDFRDYLEFILAVLVAKGKIRLNKKEIFEMIYNIKAIDRKIQLETLRYPNLKEEFDKAVRVKFEIDKKEELRNMSDLAYSVYNYMTGDDGTDLIRIKEVEDKNN